ncbi:MAG: hypothetical protein AB2L26_10890 [Ignavibacteria bacterium]
METEILWLYGMIGEIQTKKSFVSYSIRLDKRPAAISVWCHPGYSPDVAVRKDGSFGLCWVDSFPKFRLFNKNGVPISNVIKIDSVNFPQANTPSIACDSSGNFVVVFQRKITLTYLNIHFQLFDSLGNKVGSGGQGK